MAAGDLRGERNEKIEKKAGSPQGWEEGKNEGITFPLFKGISFFNKLPQFTAPQTLICPTLYEEYISHYFLNSFFEVIVSFVVASFFWCCALWDTTPFTLSYLPYYVSAEI